MIPRQALNGRLWGRVRALPGGEPRLRELVAAIHQEDGTGGKLAPELTTSTKCLTYDQLARLERRVVAECPRQRRRRSPTGDAVWLATDRERKYARWMARQLGWSAESFEEFCGRQAKRPSPATHNQASAVIEPLERLMRQAGWHCEEERDGSKWWSPGAVQP